MAGDLRRHGLGDGEIRGVDGGRRHGARTRSGRLRFGQVRQTHQTRVRESLLPLPAHQQKEVRLYENDLIANLDKLAR